MIILLTGSNGFLGKYIYNELCNIHQVETLSRSNAFINTDLSVRCPTFTKKYDLVIHCAGKAHFVPKSLRDESLFFAANVKGLKNLLGSLEQSNLVPKYFVFISSVAVYGIEQGNNISEDAPLLAQDAYGLSKIKAEQSVQEWCAVNNVRCTILRLPLLVGLNPPGNLGAMINAINKGYYFNIGEGSARKSMVLAEDVAKIILKSSEIGGIFNLTDGIHPSFYELSLHITKLFNKSAPLKIPFYLAMLIARIGDLLGGKAPLNFRKFLKITSDLTFDDSKAKQFLGWKPTPVLKAIKLK